MAESNPIAKAYVQIVPTTKNISTNIAGSMGDAGKQSGKNFVSGMMGEIAKIGAGVKILDVIKTGLNLGAELEQNLGGTKAVFGEFAKNIQTTAQNAYKNMGLSASDYMATANKMGSLFQGSGVEQEKALQLTSQAMQRAADVASVMGLDTSAAMESIAGAAKGNFTMMDNLGVAMNATTLQAYALEKGVNFNWNTASNAEKAELAMQMFMDRTSQYAGNFARESEETLTGSIGAMKSAIQNLLGNLATGADVTKPMASIIQTASAFLFKNLLPMIFNIAKAVPEALAAGIGTIFEGVGTESMLSFIDSIIASIPQVLETFSGMVNAAIDKIVEMLPSIAKTGFDLVLGLINGIISNLPGITSAAFNVVTGWIAKIWENLPSILETGITLLGEFAAGIIAAVPDLIGQLPQVISSIVESLMSYDWLSLGADIIGGIGKGIANAVSSLVDAAIKACGQLVDSIKSFFGIASPSRLMAKQIGRFIPAGLAMGIEGNMGIVSRAMDDMNQLVIGGADSRLANSAIRLDADQSARENFSAGLVQNITINSPKELNPSETARLNRNATREMILALKEV